MSKKRARLLYESYLANDNFPTFVEDFALDLLAGYVKFNMKGKK